MQRRELIDPVLQSWEGRHAVARDHLIPWFARHVPLEGARVVEYGCGTGGVAVALSPRVGSLVGLDIDAGAVEFARTAARERGLENVAFEHHGVDAILDRLAQQEGDVDVVVLYAVLEHMTVAERLELLRIARRVTHPHGHIVVCETPNRLHRWDHHTAQMPFFSMLPAELQALYYDRSRRSDFVTAVDTARGQGGDALAEALVRWGRGMSFHEFEVVFGDLSRHVVATGLESALMTERPVGGDEVELARFLDSHLPHLAAGWSRYWLDLVLTSEPMDDPPSQMRCWSMEPDAESAPCRWTASNAVQMPYPTAPLRVTFDPPAGRVACSFLVPDTGGTLTATPVGNADPTPGTIVCRTGGEPAHGELRWSEPVSAVDIVLDRPGYISFVGWTP